MSCPLNCDCQLALMLCARSRDPLWDNFSLLGDEAVQALFILIVDISIFGLAKTAFPLLFSVVDSFAGILLI